MVWALGDELGFHIDGVAPLAPTLLDLAILMQDPVHGADRAMVEALVEQGCVDFGRSLVHEPRLAQQVDDALAFVSRQSPRGFGPWADSHGRPCRRHLAAMEGGARQPDRRAGGGDHPTARRQGRHGVHQGSSPLTIGRPSSKATFFWISMTASAR